MAHAIHHIHRRKRVHQKLEEYPHKHPGIRFLDNLLIAIAIIGPMNNLPQIIKIFAIKDATGVSVLSFSLFILFDIPWVVYGFVHKEKPIIIAYVLWLITNMIVVFGAILY